jgi:ribosomal protein L37AE/L43A
MANLKTHNGITDYNQDYIKKEIELLLARNAELHKRLKEAEADRDNYAAQVKEASAILKDFLTTKECNQTWVDEMHLTIEAFYKEVEAKKVSPLRCPRCHSVQVNKSSGYIWCNACNHKTNKVGESFELSENEKLNYDAIYSPAARSDMKKNGVPVAGFAGMGSTKDGY